MEYSLYLVGSRARGDENVNSDIDYVCIYDKVKPSLDLPMGSVSYYSIPRMEWMIKNSKLFVAHLINEGKPLIERETHRQLLSSFVLDVDILRQDRAEFVRCLSSLDWIPPGISGLRWACDYIYTISRNIIYISNALDGYFQFGYIDAVSNFLKQRSRKDLLPAFIRLRDEKYKYRTGDLESSDFDITLLNGISSMLSGLHISLVTGGVSNLGYHEKFSYEILRLLERAIVNGEVDDVDYIQKLQNHGEYFFALRESARSLCTKLQYACDNFHPKLA